MMELGRSNLGKVILGPNRLDLFAFLKCNKAKSASSDLFFYYLSIVLGFVYFML